MKDIDKLIKINVEYVKKKGLLNSTKICFKKRLERKQRENLDKIFRQNKINRIWSGMECVLLK